MWSNEITLLDIKILSVTQKQFQVFRIVIYNFNFFFLYKPHCHLLFTPHVFWLYNSVEHCLCQIEHMTYFSAKLFDWIGTFEIIVWDLNSCVELLISCQESVQQNFSKTLSI